MVCKSLIIVTERTISPLHIPPSDPQCAESAIGHFYEKLVHIQDRLKTNPGRKIGAKRHQVVSTFALQLVLSLTINRLWIFSNPSTRNPVGS